MRRAFLISLFLPAFLLASDPSGRWRAEMPKFNGQQMWEVIEITVKDSAVTGTFHDAFKNPHKIQDGKWDGKKISWRMLWQKVDGKDEWASITGYLDGETLVLRFKAGPQDRKIIYHRAAK